MAITKLLTAAEAAERLRCRPSKIKRLRLAGLLAYMPTRPVLIPETALEAYIAEATAKAAAKVAASAKARSGGKWCGPGEEPENEVRARARRFFDQQEMRKQIEKNLRQRKAFAAQKAADAERLARKKATKHSKP